MHTTRVIRTNPEYIRENDIDIIEEVPTDAKPVVVTDTTSEKNVTLFRTYQVVWFLLGIIETLLVFRFIFHLLGANMFSPFISFIYTITALLIAPFVGILPSVISGSSILEWSTIIAGVVYLVLAYGLFELIRLLTPVHTTRDASLTRRSRYAV
jgi:hypothetical protein